MYVHVASSVAIFCFTLPRIISLLFVIRQRFFLKILYFLLCVCQFYVKIFLCMYFLLICSFVLLIHIHTSQIAERMHFKCTQMNQIAVKVYNSFVDIVAIIFLLSQNYSCDFLALFSFISKQTFLYRLFG